jgi:hypothetical protein
MDEWKTMDTAPRSERILVWDGDQISVAAWEIINKDGVTGWWRYQAGPASAEFSDFGVSPVCENPTHWMPLPEPPSIEAPEPRI